MIAEFIDGLQKFHFLQNALITAIVVGVVAGAVGCFIILRGMSLMGDAISHAVLPGVASPSSWVLTSLSEPLSLDC